MEAARPKKSKKARNKAAKSNRDTANGASLHSAGAEASAKVVIANGANGSASNGSHAIDGLDEDWMLDREISEVNDDSSLAVPDSVTVAVKNLSRNVDDDIAQNEDDLMALLAGPSTSVVASPIPVQRIHPSKSSTLEEAGTLTATSVPSAPNFDDSDDEDQMAFAQASAGTNGHIQSTSLPGSEPALVSAEHDEATEDLPQPRTHSVSVGPSAPPDIDDVADRTEAVSPATIKLRPSAPPEPSDSPHLPAAHATTSVPSAPLEDEDFDVSTRATPLRIVVPTAPSFVEDAQPTTVVEPSSVELKNEASVHEAATIQNHRVKSSMPGDVKKAGETVRNSFAKSRASEHGTRLYPAVADDNVVRNGSARGDPVFEIKPSTSSVPAAEKYPIYIKLEPHSNYEMNIMKAAAAQKPQQAKMHNIEINKGDLYARLERYLFAEYLLHTTSATLDARKKEVDAMIQRVWLLEMKRLSSSSKCGDQIDMEEILEFQTARFDPLHHARLKTHLESLRQLRSVEASLHTFDRALSYFHVEQYLNEVLQERGFVSYLNKMSAASVASSRIKAASFGEFEILPETISFYEPLPSESTLASSVEHLKYCIDVMIFFEKKVTVDDRGLFGRVPPSFARGDLVWHSNGGNRATNGSSERRIKCYACSTLNTPMEPNQWCKFCASCGVTLYLPPSSVSTKSNEWYASVLRFRQSLQKWISLCLRTLLRLRSLVNMPYVLMHVMYLPRIATEERSWILRFFQFPKALVSATGDLKESWSEDLVDHYVAMLHLVFHPEKLRRLTTLVSSEIPTRHKGPREKNGDTSLEWVLLENPEVLDRWYLSDEDFVAVINQFPNTFAFEQVFSTSIDTKKCFSRALALVIEFTQGLRLFQEFEKFPARVADLLGELLLNASLVSVASSSMSRNGEGFFYPTLFDQLFLTALHGLLVADCNRVAWRSLRDFPFAPLSALAKWDVLGLLLFGISSVPSSAKSAAGWSDFIAHASVGKADKVKPARMVLHNHIMADPDNAMHLMHAVARLAASAACEEDDGTGASLGRDLVLVTTQELFLAGYVNADCRRALGDSGERAARPISTLCLAHPWVISELISLLFKYHECVETWIHVFETFPVNRWLPSPSDLSSLQEWLLLDDTSAPRSALARFLLDRINWEFDVKAGQLFTNPYLHRQVGLVVAEALLVHRSRKSNPSRDLSARQTNGDGVVSPQKLKAFTKSIRRVFRFSRQVDFEGWCWKLMLKLRFYSPRTHQPFVELVNLKQDRSREALLLRRWFPGGVEDLSHGGGPPPSVQYYPSHDHQFHGASQQAVVAKEEFVHKAALAGSGSSGAPIQDESTAAVLTTDESSAVSDLGESAELVSSVAVSSTCDVEPIVAYLICQVTTFVFSDRMDRWEPLLVLLKNRFFAAGVKVLENVLPLMARLSQSAAVDGVPRPDAVDIDHGVTVCMASMAELSTEHMLQLVEAMARHSFISADECQLLSDLLQKGYIGGWESTAKSKVLDKLRFVRECSTYLHPLVLPSLINESFPQSTASMMSTAAMLQGAMSWLTSALRGGRSDPPSPSAAHSITSALTIRNSHLVAAVPTAASAPAVTAAAAAATLGIVDAPDDHSTTTQQLCNLIGRAFENSTSSGLNEIATYWLRMVLQVPLWFEHPALRHVVDVLLQCSMHALYVTQKNGVPGSARGALHGRLVSILSQSYATYCHRLRASAEAEQTSVGATDGEFPPVVSFLLPSSSIPALASIFGGLVDPSQYVGGCATFAFWGLLTEVRQELPLFLAMGRLLIKYEPAAMKKIEKMKKTESKLTLELAAVDLPGVTNRFVGLAYGHLTTESLAQFKIYRWAEYCIQLREDEEIQILFWQVFFALYLACAGGSRVFGHYFLDREESSNPKHLELRKLLQAKLRGMTTYSSNQAQLVLIVLTATGGSATGNLTSEGKELKYHHYVQLSHIYTAMDAWLEEREPNKWLDDTELATLPRHFEVARLREVLTLSDRLLNTPGEDAVRWDTLPLWFELCGFEFHAARSRVVEEDGASDAQLTVTTTNDHYQEEDFAFVEDRDMRRFSSLGSSADHGRTTSPLALTPEYAGPTALTVLPQVTIETSPERCVLTPSVPLNKHALKTLATKFSETLSILIGLDAEVLDHISKLYVSKPRVITESKACLEGTNCRKPAAFRFEFIEWSMDRELMDTVQSTIAQAERYDMRSMGQQSAISASLATQLIDTERRRNESSLLFDGVDSFLQLDADGVMLSMQILLIDHAVQMLENESERLKRAVIVAQATADTKHEEATKEGDEEVASDEVRDETERVVDAGAKAIQDAEAQVQRLHDKGLEWFRQLTELDTRLARMVPPLREVLWRSIKQLGIAFVCVDERETCNLLNLMLEDPSRITLLSECFSPSSAPARFVEMFSNLMNVNASSKLSSEEKLILLQRFDFQAWLHTKPPHAPTKFDRDTVLSIVLGDIRSSSYKNASAVVVDHNARTRSFGTPVSRAQSPNSDDAILRLYAKIINQICCKHLGDHLEKVLHALVGVHDDYRFNNSTSGAAQNASGDETSRAVRPAPAIVWEAVVSIPSTTWQQIPFVQVESCVSFLNQHMTSLRWQASMASSSDADSAAAYPIVAWQKSGALKSYLDLFTQLSRTIPEQNRWSMITSFFEPLLTTLYQPSTTTESSSVSCPWTEQEAMSTGTTLCSCFVAICTDYLKTAKSKPLDAGIDDRRGQVDSIKNKLDLVWRFYVNTLVPHAPVHVCKSFHQFLTRLGWEQWCLTIEIVQQMRDIVQSERQQLAVSASCADLREAAATSPYPYVSWMIRDVLCRLTWKATEDWLSTQSESMRSVFVMELAKLCVDLVLDLPHFQPPPGRSKNSRSASPGASTNVLPPYFVNFIKQQSTLWAKWKINDAELETLLNYIFDAIIQPIRDLTLPEDAAVFPANPSVAVMQDGFARLQLVLRLASQVTTLNHSLLTKTECLKRTNLFLKLVFTTFETGMATVMSAGEYTPVDPSAWTIVLFGATCTVLYEKLDEIVQISRVASDSSSPLAEEDLLPTLVEVLRLFNLRLVEGFFRREQQNDTSNISLVWGKCGNVVFVEVDSLIRDFPAARNARNSRTNSGDRLLTDAASSSALASDVQQLNGINGGGKPSSIVESIGSPLGRLLWSFMGFRGGELCCLSACGRAIASVQVMSLVAERSIEKWIIEERRGAWADLVTRLKVPELSEDELESACLQQGNLMTLQLLFLQHVRKAPAMTEAFASGILSKLLSWMDKLLQISVTTPVMDMKILFLAAEVTNFVHTSLKHVLADEHKKQQLRALCNIMLSFGNARRQHGIMKAIGIGGSLKYSVEFHVCSLTIGIFLRLQTRSGAPIRVDERIPYKLTRTTEKHLKSLEQLLASKNCFHLQKRMEWLVDFLRTPSRSLADQDEFFVSLFSRMYPSHPWLLAKCVTTS